MVMFCAVNSVGHVCVLVVSFVVGLICGVCVFGFCVYCCFGGLMFAVIYLPLLSMLWLSFVVGCLLIGLVSGVGFRFVVYILAGVLAYGGSFVTCCLRILVV